MCYLRCMDWSAIVSGAVGALAGAAIPGFVSYLGLRSEWSRQLVAWRRSEDAPVIAEAKILLLDLGPDKAANTSSASAAELGLKEFADRSAAIRTKLLAMAAGHPSEPVRSCAEQLEVQVAAATVQTQWLVKDQASHQETPGQRDIAVKSHKTATATAANLQKLIIAFGSGGKPKWG